MSKKKNKRIKKLGIKQLSFGVSVIPTLCGFPLIQKNINNLFNWQTMEDVKF